MRVFKIKALRATICEGVSTLFLIVLFSCQAVAEQRLALIISNSNYGGATSYLENALADAHALRDELVNDGFIVQLKENLTKQLMKGALTNFQSKIEPGDTVLFFFNGIGLQLNGQTYLIPSDAQIWTEADVKRDGASLDTLLSDLASAKSAAKIIIVDAAKRNPFERHFRDAPEGLAAVDTPSGSLVLLSASPGKLVPDNEEPNGSFMSELIRQIRLPGNAEDAFRRARLGVYHSSKGEQVPWVSSSLVREFSFLSGNKKLDESENPASPAVASAPAASSSPDSSGPSDVVRPPSNGGSSDSSDDEESEPPARAAPQPSPQPRPSTVSPAGLIFKDCDECPELVVVSAGEFTMGSGDHPHEKPAHKIKITHPFAIGRYELTFADWDQCVDAGACRNRPDSHGLQRDKYPVGDVSWEDANAYLKWLSAKTGQVYRLPTEAEWEYASRAGSPKRFSWGNEAGAGNANCSDCGSGAGGKLSPVGSYKPNAFGLFDTAGNVAEWVQDCWNESYSGAPADGAPWLSGNCGLRGLRGGSFNSNAQFCRPSARFRYDSDVRYEANGFRVLRTLQ
jgi:formylglycine-generating enzyme required for sulfatase activity